MLAALLLLGIVPLSMMDFDRLGERDDEDVTPQDDDDGVAGHDTDADNMLDDMYPDPAEVDETTPAQTLGFGAGDGMAVIEGFRPGTDRVEIDLGTESELLEVVTGEAEGGPALSVGDIEGDTPGTTLVFQGLDDLPGDDIFFLNAGAQGETVVLSDLLQTAEPLDPADPDAQDAGLAPADPDAPEALASFSAASVGLAPADPDVGDDMNDAGLAPVDPDAPETGGDTSSDPGLTPGDPDAPETGGGTSSDPGLDPVDPDARDPMPPSDALDRLAELLARDGAALGGLDDALARADAAWVSLTELGQGDDTHAEPETGDGGQLTLSSGTPVLSSAETQAIVDGGAGDDTMTGGGGPAWLFGGAGNDSILAGSGGTAAFGGAGDDTLTATAQDRVYLDGGSGDDVIRGGDGDDILEGGEHAALQTASDNDVIDGGAGNDIIRGGHGADVLLGGDGNDVIDHHGRDDLRSGDAGSAFAWRIDGAADTLSGGAGDDTLIFDRFDTASGGSGADVFWLHHDANGTGGIAEVTDFETGADFLRITLNPDAGHGPSPQLSVTAVGEDAEVRVDGELIALLRGAADATAADIFVEVRADVFA